MPSVNNIYMVAGEPYARYVKTLRSLVSGMRLNPTTQVMTPVDFVVASHPERFEYDSEVIEIYSEQEDRYFKQANRSLFQSGLLKAYDGAKELPPLENFMSDEEVKQIATIKNTNELRTRLLKVDSPITLARILSAAEEANATKRVLDAIRERKAEISAGSE